MKKPNDLLSLIEQLENEEFTSTVHTERDSHAIVHTEFSEDDGIMLNARECSLLLHSKHTVNQLYDALGTPADATIVLYDLMLEDDALAALESAFTAVDEA